MWLYTRISRVQIINELRSLQFGWIPNPILMQSAAAHLMPVVTRGATDE